MLNFIANIFLSISLIIVTLLLVPLTPFGAQWYQLVVVQSASMLPIIPVGSLAVYQPREYYVPDEIVVFQQEVNHKLELVLHRIVEKKVNNNIEIAYLVKGDALEDAQASLVFSHQVKGKIIGVIPMMGFMIAWWQTSVGITILILTPLFLLLIIEFSKSS